MEISINGKLVKKEKVPESWILQTEVVYEPGEIRVAEIIGRNKQKEARLFTTGEMARIRITQENTANVTEEYAGVLICKIEAVDADGNVVPCEDAQIRIEVDGGELIGAGSANPVNTDDYTSGICRLFEGRTLLIADKKSDPMTISVDCKGKKVIIHA